MIIIINNAPAFFVRFVKARKRNLFSLNTTKKMKRANIEFSLRFLFVSEMGGEEDDVQSSFYIFFALIPLPSAVLPFFSFSNKHLFFAL